MQEIETNGPATGVRKLLERLSGWKARRETKAAAITKAKSPSDGLSKAPGGRIQSRQAARFRVGNGRETAFPAIIGKQSGNG